MFVESFNGCKDKLQKRFLFFSDLDRSCCILIKFSILAVI